jgi:hypothetical protein
MQQPAGLMASGDARSGSTGCAACVPDVWRQVAPLLLLPHLLQVRAELGLEAVLDAGAARRALDVQRRHDDSRLS